MSNVSVLNDAGFKDFVKKHKLVLIDFYAEWCGPCHALKPVIDELAGEMKGIAFAKMNIDENSGSAQEYGIMSIPTMLIFKAGRMVDRLTGALPKAMIRQRLEKLMD